MKAGQVGALLGLRGLTADDAGGDLQCRKEVDRTVALVSALHSLDDLAAASAVN